MKLETHCQDCRAPLVIPLPDDIGEGEAQAIASRLRCVPCAVIRMALATCNHFATKTQPSPTHDQDKKM
jgi:hypothetical protein